MSVVGSDLQPDGDEAASWASETLPMALRRELLQRELQKLGLRKEAAVFGGSANDGSVVAQQDAPSPPGGAAAQSGS